MMMEIVFITGSDADNIDYYSWYHSISLSICLIYTLKSHESLLARSLIIAFSIVKKWWTTENRFAKMQWTEKQMEKVKQVREMFDK